MPRTTAWRLGALLWPLMATAALGATLSQDDAPRVCREGTWLENGMRLPREVQEYVNRLGSRRFDLRAACAQWAGFTPRRQDSPDSARGVHAARLILFPDPATDVRRVATTIAKSGLARRLERTRDYLIATFDERLTGARLQEILATASVEYAEPDCEGPDFMATSQELNTGLGPDCWRRSARSVFPNDPCIDELWGHALIGWRPEVAARSIPRIVAVLDSGIDASHEDLRRNILHRSIGTLRSQSAWLNEQCATSGRCFNHGTQMAGTIAGRMDNGIGVAGVAPNSLMLPIVISSVDNRLLARLSTIAQGIEAAANSGADIINISAKWPVDSRAISNAILGAVGGDAARQRLIVTGYTSTLRGDDTLREYYPSRYRCLPGVLAAVPTDMRGRNLSNPGSRPNAKDGRIQAPGVDIVVTTTENSERGYTLSEAAGASSAAAYVSGALALVWGSPPLNNCDAQQIKELLFCRSKSSDSTRYPWINVDFLRELTRVEPGSQCASAMGALGCI